MQTVHPLFRAAVAPFAPPAMRPFVVAISGHDEVHILAESSSDAIVRAISVLFGEECFPPSSFKLSVKPIFPRAA